MPDKNKLLFELHFLFIKEGKLEKAFEVLNLTDCNSLDRIDEATPEYTEIVRDKGLLTNVINNLINLSENNAKLSNYYFHNISVALLELDFRHRSGEEFK